MQRLDDIFHLRYGHSLELNALKRVHAPEGVNFVSRAMGNNGVTARVDVKVAPAKAGELSVALGGNGVLSTFVQPEPFVCGRDVMILTPIEPTMGITEKLWWARCIWENRYRFSYGRQANRTLGSLLVPDAVPGWVHQTQLPTHDGLAKSSAAPLALTDPHGQCWSNFTLGELFDIKKGKRLTKAERVPGKTRFVSASEKNNGITDMNDVPAIFPAGVLTVVYNGNSVGHAFYQDEPFFASDDVNVLLPKVSVSRWAQLFVAAIIKYGRTRFTYGYKWTLARMKQTVIRLPVKCSGEPDWDYMEAFMRGLPFSAAIGESS
ncbi:MULTISPECIES: restriction endonuclease subunit S [unclassified Streptomyces]|uniref:restriction endonuclease subunit S n=1 Tax=unclassified Streptomyces TaxID=2593676 RepID=UPI00081D7EAF|nr:MULTISPECIES: restriction endonuclease subunit S [unclassified Streptomyces]MYR27349.1 restriction endonuclease subunit S [Streptomyces sp. SID4945]SCD49516.1 Type I restriction modification DNA specificity domain-containing protein [Streptomyces sp. TverLS-915]SCF22246.1 Type I restriction modification DNA specificity domain-containing protein [Streptomyces sp. LcepLS]